MNWDAIGAVSEIVGAAAVVISLMYLAVQIRNQNAESKAGAMRDISEAFRASSAIFTDGELAEIFVKATADFGSLSDAETIRFISAMHPVLRVFEEAFNQRLRGRLDDDLWEGINRQYSSYLSAPAIQEYWKIRRNHYTDRFQRFVDEMERTEWGLE